jgi:subtilisin family serine protease
MIMKELNDVEIFQSLPDDSNHALKMINVEEAWKKTKGKGVKIAVIDTGVDMTHPDLIHSLRIMINMHNRTTDVSDEYGHGSHVAGLLTGLYTGVAPEADLYIAKVLNDEGQGTMANVSDGIAFAINCGVDVLCMSLGVPFDLPTALKQKLYDAEAKGITVVCAVGNGNKNTLEYPSKYDEIVAVGGVDENYQRARFSNFGKEIDIVAPSVNILSTYKDNNYAKMSGTSMASPLVAGAIALLIADSRSKGIELKPKEIREIISTRLNLDHSYDYGWGVLDVAKLLG